MKDQVEERLNFFATGEKPKQNADAMREVLEELKEEGLYVTTAEGHLFKAETGMEGWALFP